MGQRSSSPAEVVAPEHHAPQNPPQQTETEPVESLPQPPQGVEDDPVIFRPPDPGIVTDTGVSSVEASDPSEANSTDDRQPTPTDNDQTLTTDKDDKYQFADSIHVLSTFWKNHVMSLHSLKSSAAEYDSYTELCIMFYAALFKRLPECRQLFLNVDVKKQALLFMGMMGWLISRLVREDAENVIIMLKRLGQRHSESGVTEDMYPVMLEALHETFSEKLGLRVYTARVRFCWSQLFQVCSDIMIGKDFTAKTMGHLIAEEVMQYITNFDICMAHKKGSQLLRSFMCQQFCVELYDFYAMFLKFKAIQMTRTIPQSHHHHHHSIQQQHQHHQQIYHSHQCQRMNSRIVYTTNTLGSSAVAAPPGNGQITGHIKHKLNSITMQYGMVEEKEASLTEEHKSAEAVSVPDRGIERTKQSQSLCSAGSAGSGSVCQPVEVVSVIGSSGSSFGSLDSTPSLPPEKKKKDTEEAKDETGAESVNTGGSGGSPSQSSQCSESVRSKSALNPAQRMHRSVAGLTSSVSPGSTEYRWLAYSSVSQPNYDRNRSGHHTSSSLLPRSTDNNKAIRRSHHHTQAHPAKNYEIDRPLTYLRLLLANTESYEVTTTPTSGQIGSLSKGRPGSPEYDSPEQFPWRFPVHRKDSLGKMSTDVSECYHCACMVQGRLTDDRCCSRKHSVKPTVVESEELRQALGKRDRLGRLLFERFIRPGSPMEINLPDSVRTALISEFRHYVPSMFALSQGRGASSKQEHLPAEIFDNAAAAVHYLICSHIWSKFQVVMLDICQGHVLYNQWEVEQIRREIQKRQWMKRMRRMDTRDSESPETSGLIQTPTPETSGLSPDSTDTSIALRIELPSQPLRSIKIVAPVVSPLGGACTTASTRSFSIPPDCSLPRPIDSSSDAAQGRSEHSLTFGGAGAIEDSALGGEQHSSQGALLLDMLSTSSDPASNTSVTQIVLADGTDSVKQITTSDLIWPNKPDDDVKDCPTSLSAESGSVCMSGEEGSETTDVSDHNSRLDHRCRLSSSIGVSNQRRSLTNNPYQILIQSARRANGESDDSGSLRNQQSQTLSRSMDLSLHLLLIAGKQDQSTSVRKMKHSTSGSMTTLKTCSERSLVHPRVVRRRSSRGRNCRTARLVARSLSVDGSRKSYIPCKIGKQS